MHSKTRFPAWFVLLTGVALLAGCGASMGDSSGGESPTGTFFGPPEEGSGLSPGSYVALDEACERTDDADYLRRFETPMFRSVAERDGVAWMVDGSLLWAVDVSVPASPRRLSLTRLEGHPLQVDVTAAGLLLVAAGEAGLHVVDVQDATAPALVNTVPLDDLALDVRVAGDLAVVAVGGSGVRVLRVGPTGTATMLAAVDVPGHAVAVDVEEGRAYVAACSALSLLSLSDPQAPELLSSFWVPYGHAKDVDADQGQIYVAGGEALFAYDAVDATHVLWKGYYAEPDVEGFYVNAVVAQDGIVYIAAGDESVRSVDVDKLSDTEGFKTQPVQSEEPPPGLGGPETLDDPTVIVEPADVDWDDSDPIGIGIRDDLLMVLGNFRWMGERTLFLMRVTPAGMMTDITAYVQPNRWVGIARHEDRLVLLGEDGVNRAVSLSGGAPVELDVEEPVREALSLPSGLYLLTESGTVHRWQAGASATEVVVAPAPGGMGAEGMTGAQERLYLSDRQRNSIGVHELPGGMRVDELTTEMGFLGWARVAATADSLYAYDWELGRLHSIPLLDSLTDAATQFVGHCELYDIRDYFAGDKESRSRLLIRGDELLLLCPRDEQGRTTVQRFSLAEADHPVWTATVELPTGRHVAFDTVGEGVVTLQFDNDRYVSTIAFSAGGVHHATTFTGVGNGLVVSGTTAYVADGEGGLRAFDLSAGGAPVPVTAPDIH